MAGRASVVILIPSIKQDSIPFSANAEGHGTSGFCASLLIRRNRYLFAALSICTFSCAMCGSLLIDVLESNLDGRKLEFCADHVHVAAVVSDTDESLVIE